MVRWKKHNGNKSMPEKMKVTPRRVLLVVGIANICWHRPSTMGLTPSIIVIVWLGLSMLDGCSSMAIYPTSINASTNTTAPPTHILRVRIRVHNSLIETLVNPKQLDLIEKQLRQRHIPFRQIQDNKDGITIIIGPFHKSTNLTATMMMFNQSRFHTNFTTILPIIQTSNSNHLPNETTKIKIQTEHFPMSVEAHEYDLAHDQESYEFRNCLEACEIYEGKELKPDHNCIRKKCLKEITGI